MLPDAAEINSVCDWENSLEDHPGYSTIYYFWCFIEFLKGLKVFIQSLLLIQGELTVLGRFLFKKIKICEKIDEENIFFFNFAGKDRAAPRRCPVAGTRSIILLRTSSGTRWVAWDSGKASPSTTTRSWPFGFTTTPSWTNGSGTPKALILLNLSYRYLYVKLQHTLTF